MNVYGLGLKAEKPERVFSFTTISYADYLNIDKETYIGVDWGQNDPFAIVEVKYYDGNLYVHELNYLSENKWLEKLSQEERVHLMHSIKLRQGKNFFCCSLTTTISYAIINQSLQNIIWHYLPMIQHFVT